MFVQLLRKTFLWKKNTWTPKTSNMRLKNAGSKIYFAPYIALLYAVGDSPTSKMLWIALVSLEHGQNSIEFVCKLCVSGLTECRRPQDNSAVTPKRVCRCKLRVWTRCFFLRKYRDILCRKKQLLTLENRSPACCLVSRASQSPCSLCSSRQAIINFHKCHSTIDSI